MKKKSASPDQGPLDWFLARIDGDESTLAVFAQEIAKETFDADTFRNELLTKLKRLRYPQPDPERGLGKKTFYEYLEHAGTLQQLLRDDSLKSLWQRRLLKDLFKKDDDISARQLSTEGISLSQHKRKVKKIEKDLKTLENIAAEYGLQAILAEAQEKLTRESIRELRAIVLTRYRGSRAEVILSRPSGELASDVRSEVTAIQAIIYRTLRDRLQTSTNKRRDGMSDIFLCQLAELVWAGLDVSRLSNGETIRRAANRLQLSK